MPSIISLINSSNKSMKTNETQRRSRASQILRTFEENQISNIKQRTKGKRTMKFHQFYSAKKYPKGYAQVSETILSQLEIAKKTSFSTENLKKH